MNLFAFKRAHATIRAIARAMLARAMALTLKILKPYSANEDKRRQEYILNTILIISLLFLTLLRITIIWNIIRYKSTYQGISPILFDIIIVGFVVLFILSKKGFGRIASYVLVGCYAIGALSSGWVWGMSLPATLLTSALVIVTASVLIGSVFGFITAGTMIGALAILGIHEAVVLHIPRWRLDPVSTTDIVTYTGMFLFITFISWLSNREMEKILGRAKHSEYLLEMERNSLEERIAKRTKELIEIESSRTADLKQLAQFGELSQGLFHDLMNPLFSIALYVEHLDGSPKKDQEAKEIIQKAVAASRRMRSFMDSVKRNLQSNTHSRNESTALVDEEIKIVQDILSYKARMANVQITVKECESIKLHIHPVRLHQVLLNLISNAVDACIMNHRKFSYLKKINSGVLISAQRIENSAVIKISDTGHGILPEHLSRIFIDPFTTKADGSGMGLITVRSIVENELYGKISVTSTARQGTTFKITIPLSHKVQEQNFVKKELIP